ncbi:MAG: BamA/TamA family outer membrane protein, partial [Candidatus Cloacimonas sp.]|nr:BamA/TamA family outer membrane protein [Candidatus Cloacimonas sp.]
TLFRSVTELTAQFYAYLNASGQYFYHIPAPELIPINGEQLELLYAFREVAASSRVTVRFGGLQYFSEDKLHQLLLSSSQQEYRLEQLPRLMQQVIGLYHSRSYLFARVQLDSLVLNPLGVAYIGISEGKPLRVKQYIFRGNKITHDKTLLSLSGLATAKNITPEILSQAEENILHKSYIRDCVVQPIDESSLLIRVEEGRMTFLEGVLGMSDTEAGMKLSGSLRLQFLNLWGSDRAVKLFWKQIPTANKELSLAYHDSGFPGLPFAADVEIYRSEQDSTWVKSKAAIDLYYQMLLQKVGLELAGESVKPGARRPALIESTSSRSMGAFWDYSRVEGGSNPIRGIQANLRYRFIDGSVSGKLSGSLEAGGKTYIPITTRWVGHIGIQIRNLDNEQAATWEQVKMGGYGTLRGYREDEFSSFRLAWTNYELRYRLNPDSRVYVFFDSGFLGKANNTIKSDIFGLGGGIKVKSKLGILGIEYGLGYRDKRFSRIGLGMVHAGLDLAF